MMNVGREFGGSLLLQQGELDFSPAEKPIISTLWALALGFLRPALKRTLRVELFPATLKRCFPLLKQRAPTVWTVLLAISAPAWAQQPPPASVPPGAVVLDHVVAVINGSVILESDVREEMNYAVLQPFSINSARNTPQRALQRLIDRALILQQMKTGGDTVAPPTPEELQEQIHQLRGLIPQCVEYRCETEAGWQAFLSSRGLTEKEVEQHWAQRMLILSFIQSRFGSGVRITSAEIKNYYDKTLVPRLNGVKPPPLANVSSRIEEILLQQRVSSLLLEWLQSLKSEGSVSILDPAYGKVGTSGAGDDSDSGGQS
jgi:peptidyl-prolyl cis-trans isomerase SurA